MKFILMKQKNQIQQGIVRKSQQSKESMPYQQREVTTSHKETRVAGFVKRVPNKDSIYTRKTIPRNEKKWITIHASSKRGHDLAVFVSKTVTTM